MASLKVNKVPQPEPPKEYVLTLSEEEAEFLCALTGGLGHVTGETKAYVHVRRNPVLAQEAAANGGHVQNGVNQRLWELLSNAGLDRV